MKILSADAAIDAIPDGSNVILPHGAVEPSALYSAFERRRERFRNLTLYSGLQFGPYSYLREGLGESFRYVTWQASSKLRDLFRQHRVDLLPLRYRDIVRVVRRDGPVEADVVFVQVSAPRGGKVSLGISCSLYPDLIASARLVVAEMHPDMPWTAGRSEVDVSALDLVVESEGPLGTYRSPRQSPRDAAIVDRVLEWVPAGAWVQLGVGAIPDALLPRLHEIDGVNLHSGMLSDGLVEFLARVRHSARVVTGEVAGGPDLYRAVGGESRVVFQPSTVTHDLREIAQLPKFVSVNSAVEVDLHGQVNGETVDGVQISGVGGALDFVEGAAYSPGGVSIVALPSTTEDGRRSKVVTRLAAAAAVTIPRHCVDVVITEFGAARLRGRTLAQRAEALIAIAHPDFRASLGGALGPLAPSDSGR
jgi:4-hydroxybutyrate CoA-transferase